MEFDIKAKVCRTLRLDNITLEFWWTSISYWQLVSRKMRALT